MGDEADDVIAPLEDEGEGGESQGEDSVQRFIIASDSCFMFSCFMLLCCVSVV